MIPPDNNGPITTTLTLRANLYLALLLAVIAIFYAATIRQGHIWGDDFAMYVHHAKNIVEGRPYSDTGYIYNPGAPIGPPSYPPVFPLLLAPLYRFFGLNFRIMKLEQVFFILLALAFIYANWRRDLGSRYCLALVAILGFSPHFWTAKDNVLSDLPFLLFFYLAVFFARRAPRIHKIWSRWGLLIGLTLYAATGTRTIGIALVAGFILYDVIRSRTITPVTCSALIVWAALMLLQARFVSPAIGSYTGYIYPSFHALRLNLVTYIRASAGFWVASMYNAYSFVVLAIVTVLTTAGLIFQFRRGFTVVEALLAPYLTIVILWPFATGIRLIYPVLPWLAFLALLGLHGLADRFAPRLSMAALAVLLLLVAIPYLAAYEKTDFGTIAQDNGLPEFNQLCQAVRGRTAGGDVLIYYRARSLALYTNRTASSYNYLGTAEDLWRYAERIHATYVVTTNAFDTDRGFLASWASQQSPYLDLIYENASFRLYRIRSIPSELSTQYR